MAPSGSSKQIPITREFLATFYSQHPLIPVAEEVEDVIERVDKLITAVGRKGSSLSSTVGMDTPTRIDDCFWRNRQLCEDLADRLHSVLELMIKSGGVTAVLGQATQARCKHLIAGEAVLLQVQNDNTEKVATMVRKFLPTGFRGQLLEAQRNRTERAYAKAVEALVRKGGSIRARYDLYLRQQWERREALAALATCTGVYKLLIKYVGGIPDELMDFAKEINAKLGPMEEQRLAYGPDLYIATELGIKLNVSLALWLENPKGLSTEDGLHQLQRTVLPATDMYVTEVTRIIRHIGAVFHISPFFITLEEANAAAASAAELPPQRLSANRLSSRNRNSHTGSLTGAEDSMYTATDSVGGQETVADEHDALTPADLSTVTCGSSTSGGAMTPVVHLHSPTAHSDQAACKALKAKLSKCVLGQEGDGLQK